MRQHVNPLSRFFQSYKELPAIEELFENSNLPIHLDIGCARGKFLIEMASSHKQYNYLGLEIRETLVLAAEKERIDLELENLRFIFCNANVSLGNWFKCMSVNPINIVSIQFPDPWFKKKHRKRRVLNDNLISILASNLKEGSKLFIQSDVEFLMKEMIDIIEDNNCFHCQNNEIYLSENPFGILTEREKYVIKEGLNVYRKLYIINNF